MRTTPDVLMVQAQRGWSKACYYLWGKLLTLSPLYYVFLLQSRAYHFAHTLRWGGADYFATARAISIDHTPFHEVFGTYSPSHFYPAADMLAMLVVATSLFRWVGRRGLGAGAGLRGCWLLATSRLYG